MFSLLHHCNPGVGDWGQDLLHRRHPGHDQQQGGGVPGGALRPLHHDHRVRGPGLGCHHIHPKELFVIRDF